MPQSRECGYCGTDIEPGTGTMYVEINGSVTHFCSSKCERNAGLGREARDQEWTAAGRAKKGRPGADTDPVETATVEDVEAEAEPARADAEDSEPTVDTTDLDEAGADESADEPADDPIEADDPASETSEEGPDETAEAAAAESDGPEAPDEPMDDGDREPAADTAEDDDVETAEVGEHSTDEETEE